jgi:hypothetical protein
MRGKHFAIFLYCLLISISAFAQSASDPWLIVTVESNGRLSRCTTHDDMIRTFGTASVLDKDEMDGFSGDIEHLTILYPGDLRRSVEIRWRDGDRKTLPASLTIRGRSSRWKTSHNISIGTSLKELQQINGRAFLLGEYNWDHPGRIIGSWQNGTLAHDLDGGHGEVRLRLAAPDPNTAGTDDTDQGNLSSNNPILLKLNPRVFEIIWEFPSWEQKHCTR